MKATTPLITLEYNSEDFKLPETRYGSFSYGRFAEKIVEVLKSNRLYEENLLYRGFSSKNIRRVMKKGNDRDKNSCQFGSGYVDYNIENILYATKEGDGKGKGRNEGWDNLELAISRAIFQSQRGLLAKLFGREGEFAISVYRSHDLIPTDPHLGEYALKEGTMPVAVIRFHRVA